MSNSFTARIAARFSPLDFTNVYGFPNTVPDVKIWEDVLPKFGGYVDENPAQHLFEFHKLMDELDVHHEDVLMKLFMFSLERDARLWYKYLPHSNIPSLKYFHIVFHQHCKRIYSAELLFQDCCNMEFIKPKDQTNSLEEEEEISEISQIDKDDQHEEEFVDKEAEYDSSCDHIQEEDQTKLHEDEAERSEGFQTDHNLICCSDGDENTFSDEELVSSSFIYDSIFNSVVQEEYFHNEFFNINDAENSLIVQHDDEIAGLDLHEDQQLMEGHIQSLFVDIEHSHFAMEKSLPYRFHDQVKALKYDELYVAKNPFHKEFQENCSHPNVIEISGMVTVVNPHENQSVDIQPSFLDPHKKEISESQCSRTFYEQPVYDEYPEEEEEKIYSSSHTKTYDSPPLFDEYDESVSEDDEQQESLVQQESNRQHHKRNQPMYDSYQEDLWTEDEGYKHGLLKQLISPPCLETIEQQTSKFQCDIFAPEEEKISSGQSAQRHFIQLAQQEEVWINCKSGVSLPFYDPVAAYMESKWGIKFFISDFLRSEFQNCKYLLPRYVLKFAVAPVVFVLKDGSIIKFVSRIFAWLIWKFSYT
jgi:hypothetical protein